MKVLIAGWAGTGKSTIAEALQAKGLPAFDSDTIPGLSSWRDRQTGTLLVIADNQPVDFNTTDWFWSPSRMEEILGEQSDLYLCGNASNLWDYIDRFDYFFTLSIDPKTQRARLINRTNSDYGKEPSVLEYTLQAQQRFIVRASAAKAIVLDATQTPEAIIAELMKYCAPTNARTTLK